MLAMLMIAQKPLDLLLLDEPTAALDSKNAHFLMKGIEKLICNTGISVICVSHDQEIVAQYAQAIIEIDQTVAGPRILKVAHLS